MLALTNEFLEHLVVDADWYKKTDNENHTPTSSNLTLQTTRTRLQKTQPTCNNCFEIFAGLCWEQLSTTRLAGSLSIELLELFNRSIVDTRRKQDWTETAQDVAGCLVEKRIWLGVYFDRRSADTHESQTLLHLYHTVMVVRRWSRLTKFSNHQPDDKVGK